VPLHSDPLAAAVRDSRTIEGRAKLLEVPKSKSRADGIHDEQNAISRWGQAEVVELKASSEDGQTATRQTLSLPVSLRGISNDSGGHVAGAQHRVGGGCQSDSLIRGGVQRKSSGVAVW